VPIGLAAIVEEWFGIPRPAARGIALLFALLILAAGWAAVFAVIAP
jgi:hypothetical protein